MAARSIGTPHRTILLRHVLPNSLPPMIVQSTINFGVTILALAALGFLGLGAQQPAPEWGLMISNGRNYFLDAWWFPVFPGLAIAIVTLGFNFLGDGLRDMIDPLTQTRGCCVLLKACVIAYCVGAGMKTGNVATQH